MLRFAQTFKESKMKNLKINFFAIVVISLFANCYTAQIGIPSNTYFGNKGISGFSGVSVSASDKEGEACATTILALISTGDASIQKAASKVGITKITSVSHETKANVFSQDVCTQVRGQ